MNRRLICTTPSDDRFEINLGSCGLTVRQIHDLLVSIDADGFDASVTIHHGDKIGDYTYRLAEQVETPVTL